VTDRVDEIRVGDTRYCLKGSPAYWEYVRDDDPNVTWRFVTLHEIPILLSHITDLEKCVVRADRDAEASAMQLVDEIKERSNLQRQVEDIPVCEDHWEEAFTEHNCLMCETQNWVAKCASMEQVVEKVTRIRDTLKVSESSKTSPAIRVLIRIRKALDSALTDDCPKADKPPITNPPQGVVEGTSKGE